jgi:putative ABC transport system permease protein
VLACNLLYGYVRANLDLTENAFTRWGARGHLMIESPVLANAAQEDAAKILLSAPVQRDVEEMLRLDGRVARFARVLEISGTVSTRRTTAIFAGIGIDVDAIRAIKGREYEYDVVAGRPLWATRERPGLVVGQDLARILGCRVPDAGFRPLGPGESPETRGFDCDDSELLISAITESGQVGALSLPITGIMDWGIKEVNERLVVVSLDQAQRLLNTTAISKYHVKLADERFMPDVRRGLERSFAGHGLPLTVYYWSDRATFYKQVRGLLLGFFAFVLALAGIVGFTSIFNTSYVNVLGRIREFGVLRSMGFSRRFVLLLCSLENAQLAMLAGIVATACSVVVTAGVRAANWSWVPPGSTNAVPITIAWSASAYASSMTVAVAVALVAGLFPALKIVNKSIREALADL